MASTSRRPDTQSTKRAAVEESVLEATLRLLAGGAHADLSIDRIAREAGISRTAFYFYFRDKREVLMRLTEGVTERLYTHADAWWSSEGEGAERLADALGAVVALYREHEVLLRAVVEASTYDDEVATFWRAVVARFVDATRDRIEIEARAGRSAGLDPERTAFALAWMTERVLYEQAEQALPADGLVEGLAGIWVRAIYD